MEEIEYKLKTNDNILISSAVSKLVLALKNMGKSEQIKNSVEFKILQESCLSPNHLLSVTSCHGMMILAQQGGLDFNYIVSTVLSSALSSKFSSGVISTLGQLLVMDMKMAVKNSCDKNYTNPFNLNTSQHPFITLLIKKPDSWNDILNQIDLILNDNALISNHKIEFLRPILLYVLVDMPNSGENTNQLQVWKLLLRELESLDVQNFVIEVLMWNKVEFDPNCSFTSVISIELLERAILLELPQIYMPIVPYLVSIIPSLLRLGADPKPSLIILKKVFEKGKLIIGVNQICMILSECINICPSVYLDDIISLCSNIIYKGSANYIAINSVVASILQWMAYSSCLTASSLNKAVELKQYIESYHLTNNSDNHGYDLFNKIKYFSFTLLKYSELSEISTKCHKDLNLLSKFLEKLGQDNNFKFIYEIRFFLLGIFVSNFNRDIILKVICILLTALKENSKFAVCLLTVILYKLANESDVKIQLELLRSLPQMAVLKENIPLIVHTLSCFKKGPVSLQSLCIDLQMRLCNIDVRCYPYLQESLVESYNDSNRWYIDVIKAISIRELCLKRPENHGTELVAHISKLLNRCVDQKGELPSSIALESIIHLCNAGVVDIVSTWRALSPRFNNEKRPRVITSLCKLFSIVPSLSSNTVEYQNLIQQLIIKLWFYITDFNEKEIIEAALEALSSFALEDIQFQYIPDIFKQNIIQPCLNNKNEDDSTQTEELLTFVPGDCWIQLLQNINHCCLSKASELISKWMSLEISQYRSGIYIVPSGKGEPNNCSNLPSKSIVRAVIDFVLNWASNKTTKDFIVLEQCLCILSKPYPKPLPPVNWCCLHDLYHQSNQFHIYCVNIATRQMVISGSAKRFIENYLSDFDAENCKEQEIITLYQNLPYYCKLLSSNIFRKVVSTSLNFSLNRALSCNENEHGNNLFKQLLKGIEISLNTTDIHDENKEIIAQNMELTLDKIHQDDELFPSFAECCLELPILYFDRMTSPTIWWETSSSKFCKAVIIRCAMSIKQKNEEKSLVWLNEIIDAGNKEANDLQNYLMIKLITVMQERQDKKYTSTNCDWCLELMGQIQAELIKLKEKNVNETIQKNSINFLCDLLILTLECLSGILCLASKSIDEVVKSDTKFNLFPASISILCTHPEWDNTMDQIIEWLYYMTTSSALAPIYLSTFQNALIVSKTHNTFGKKHFWNKVIQKKYIKIS